MAPSPATVSETIGDVPEEVVQKAPKHRWVSYIWDTFDKSPEERKLLFKLDSAILTFASLGKLWMAHGSQPVVTEVDEYRILYQVPRPNQHQQCVRLGDVSVTSCMLDVSDLTIYRKEDLGLYQNQLNYMQTCWTVGYVIGEIPSNIILTRVRPRYFIPTMELLWTVLTFSLSRCNTPTQFYVLRFFIGMLVLSPTSIDGTVLNPIYTGLAESTFYPGMQYIIGSWYRKDELAKRSCIFHTSSGIASMFSGYLMAAVYNLGGRGRFKGWQW